VEKIIPLRDSDETRALLGVQDQHVRRIREAAGVTIVTRGGALRIRGERRGVERAHRVLTTLLASLRQDGAVSEAGVTELLDRDAGRGGATERTDDAGRFIAKPVREAEPKTPGQARYVEAMRANDIVFAVGPAGTGKTFLAVAQAIEALRAGHVRRLVLVRPAIEAGERLGFLPGDVQAKVNPYLRPMYDALNSLLEFGQLRKLMEAEIVEICPLAYMRGRTLDDAYIILDEAQNTSSDQMKMFLTRMGQRSKIVVTGDITQIDLPSGRVSGLVEVKGLLRDIPGIVVCYLTKQDIVRHPLVQKIVEAYEAFEKKGKR
jgi:phosphate starvation-inducible PhoH-like protein